MLIPQQMLMVLASYALGCVSFGYYLVRFSTGQDIRKSGSGSSGATNVGRSLGIWGFSITVLLDAAKGAIAAQAALHFGLGPPVIMLAILATVAGHIWPFQLGFRGGRGVAPAIGGILVFDFHFAILIILLAAILFVLVRHFILSSLLAVLVSPAAAFLLGHSPTIVFEVSVLAFLILLSHRKHIRPMVGEFRQGEAG